MLVPPTINEIGLLYINNSGCVKMFTMTTNQSLGPVINHSFIQIYPIQSVHNWWNFSSAYENIIISVLVEWVKLSFNLQRDLFQGIYICFDNYKISLHVIQDNIDLESQNKNALTYSWETMTWYDVHQHVWNPNSWKMDICSVL